MIRPSVSARGLMAIDARASRCHGIRSIEGPSQARELTFVQYFVVHELKAYER